MPVNPIIPASYPIPAVTRKFTVDIQGVTVAIFTECGALTFTTETSSQGAASFYEGGFNSFKRVLPGPSSIGTIQLKRGMASTDDIWQWYQKVLNGIIIRRDMSIHLWENTVEAPATSAVASWNLAGALPVKYVTAPLSAKDNTIAVLSLDLICQSVTRA